MAHEVHHIKMINCSPVVPLLAKCMTEMSAHYGNNEIVIHWNHEAVYIYTNNPVAPTSLAAAMSFEHIEHMKHTWIHAVYVEPRYRRQGMYTAMWDVVEQQAILAGSRELSGGINIENMPMREAAEKVGRQAKWTTYVKELPQ